METPNLPAVSASVTFVDGITLSRSAFPSYPSAEDLAKRPGSFPGSKLYLWSPKLSMWFPYCCHVLTNDPKLYCFDEPNTFGCCAFPHTPPATFPFIPDESSATSSIIRMRVQNFQTFASNSIINLDGNTTLLTGPTGHDKKAFNSALIMWHCFYSKWQFGLPRNQTQREVPFICQPSYAIAVSVDNLFPRSSNGNNPSAQPIFIGLTFKDGTGQEWDFTFEARRYSDSDLEVRLLPNSNGHCFPPLRNAMILLAPTGEKTVQLADSTVYEPLCLDHMSTGPFCVHSLYSLQRSSPLHWNALTTFLPRILTDLDPSNPISIKVDKIGGQFCIFMERTYLTVTLQFADASLPSTNIESSLVRPLPAFVNLAHKVDGYDMIVYFLVKLLKSDLKLDGDRSASRFFPLLLDDLELVPPQLVTAMLEQMKGLLLYLQDRDGVIRSYSAFVSTDSAQPYLELLNPQRSAMKTNVVEVGDGRISLPPTPREYVNE